MAKTDDRKTHYLFKLFNNIKDEHEVSLAELELRGLFGDVGRVRNLFDVLCREPFIFFTEDDVRIQDYITHELCYGRIQGFYGLRDGLTDVTPLVTRLAYIREIYVITDICAERPEDILMRVFPRGVVGKNVQWFVKDPYVLFRFITHQYFLEKSEYVHKVSRNEAEVDRNVETLTRFLIDEIYRIPASATMRVGKRLQDYFAIREEESLYLTHYMHPYKGKFHAKMCRAILNYVLPSRDGVVMDNFAGSGTLLVEASLMGIDSIGVEINPLSVLMSNVKCFSLALDYDKLKREAYRYLRALRQELAMHDSRRKERPLIPSKVSHEKISHEIRALPADIIKKFKNDVLQKIIVARELLSDIEDENNRQFMLLVLSGTISDMARRRKADFLTVLEDRLRNLLLRIYIFKKLNETLKIDLGRSLTYMADARHMDMIEDESIDAIVTSPPYSTAINYIENDKPQLILLRLVKSLDELARNMMGHPDVKCYDRRLLYELHDGRELKELPQHSRGVIATLLKCGRRDAALRTYKFHKDMRMAIKEMYRVLRRGGKCAIIIGNNNYKVGDRVIEVKNDHIVIEMGKRIGFTLDVFLRRPLEKTSIGAIRYESVVILEK